MYAVICACMVDQAAKTAGLAGFAVSFAHFVRPLKNGILWWSLKGGLWLKAWFGGGLGGVLRGWKYWKGEGQPTAGG